MREPEKPKKGFDRYTIKSLRLNLEAAYEGKTWLLLPEGFREQECGTSYPLPSRRSELQKLAGIAIPHYSWKRDCGCLYVRRAIARFKQQQEKVCSATLDVGQRRDQVAKAHYGYTQRMRTLRQEAKKAVDEVREEAAKAVASLSDLFSLGRRGLDGQMRAHLEGEDWPHAKDCTPKKCSKDCRAEPINARAFRECFRMVCTAVKGLGLPSDQKKSANDAVMEEIAASLKSTQEVLALAPTNESETDETKN